MIELDFDLDDEFTLGNSRYRIIGIFPEPPVDVVVSSGYEVIDKVLVIDLGTKEAKND